MIASGYQLMVKQFANQRPSIENIWNNVFPTNGPQPKSLTEISGCPGTGKSILLNQLMARATLPSCHGGKHIEVIFLDLAHKFDARAFKEFLRNAMNKNTGGHSQTVYDAVIPECLKSIIYMPCYSSDQYEIAFEEMNDLLWDHKRVSLLAIDGLDTFYWEDCYYQLQRMATHYKKIIQRLKQLCQEHNIYCAYTVDKNYLLTKAKGSISSTHFPNSMIDYKIRLNENTDGSRFLNDNPIKITECGIVFLQNKVI